MLQVSEAGWQLTQDSDLQAPQSCLDGTVDLQAPGEVGLDDARGPAMQALWRTGGVRPCPCPCPCPLSTPVHPAADSGYQGHP